MDYLILLISFLIGSIPSGYLIGKIYGVDVRQQGSGNTGATNISRVVGKKAGIITLIFDILKGIVAIQIAYLCYTQSLEFSTQDFGALAGFYAFLGHCYSPFLKFKGGKGVATGLGIFLIINPPAAAIMAVIFLVTIKISGFVSLSSILAALSLPLLTYFVFPKTDICLIIAGISSLIVVYRHKQNISRLISGTEPKFIKKSA